MKSIKSLQLTISAILFSAGLGVAVPSYALPTLTGSSSDGLLAMDKSGNFWGTNKTVGKNAQQVVKFVGKRPKIVGKAYSGSLIKTLKPKGSNSIHAVEGSIEQVWPLSDGSVLFMAGVKNKGYLYKLNPTTNTVGNNPLQKFNNRQAVLNVGERYDPVLKKRVHSEEIRTLNQRSLVEATIKGKKVIFFTDYNVNAKAKPGGLHDQATLWKSTDMGNTWSTVVEWNTNGVHLVDHIHGIRQNPYNKWIYFFTGDSGKENAIVAWDGVSKPIPNNTPLTVIGLKNKYPGWRAIAGSDAVRTGDLAFTSKKLIWLPDADYIPVGAKLHGYRANHDLSGLERTGSIVFNNVSSPIIGTQDTKGVIYWASFRSNMDGSFNPPKPSPKRVQLWASYDSGLTWKAPLSIRVFNDWTAVPQNFYIAPWGELVLTGRGVNFEATANASGSSVFLKK